MSGKQFASFFWMIGIFYLSAGAENVTTQPVTQPSNRIVISAKPVEEVVLEYDGPREIATGEPLEATITIKNTGSRDMFIHGTHSESVFTFRMKEVGERVVGSWGPPVHDGTEAVRTKASYSERLNLLKLIYHNGDLQPGNYLITVSRLVCKAPEDFSPNWTLQLVEIPLRVIPK